MDVLLLGGDRYRRELHVNRVPAIPFARPPHPGNLSGHASDETDQPNHGNQPNSVGLDSSPETGGDGHWFRDDHLHPAVAVIVALWRQRQDLGRAYQRLDLQCQAVVRRYSDGDKAVAAKRWAAIQAGSDDEVAPILTPYRLAMSPLAEARAALERQLEKRAKALPIWTGWAKDVRGLGALSLAGLLGEAGLALGDYRTVSGLWKRMGLAVIGDQRQRRMSNPADALIHGYAPQRRSYAYVLSTNLMRSQREGDAYRAIYDSRKAYELSRDIPKAHAHNRALRVMVKALIRDAWAADRRLRQGANLAALPNSSPPPTNPRVEA